MTILIIPEFEIFKGDKKKLAFAYSKNICLLYGRQKNDNYQHHNDNYNNHRQYIRRKMIVWCKL